MREVKEGLLSLRQRYPIQKVTSFLIGLLIGSVGWLLFLFLPFVWPASLSFPYYAMPWFVVLFEMLFILWPAVLFCQCLLGFLFFFVAHPRQRLLATGILVMLVLIFSLGMLFGWLPSLIGAFNTIYNKAP